MMNIGRAASACIGQLVDDVKADVLSQTVGSTVPFPSDQKPTVGTDHTPQLPITHITKAS